MSHTFHAPFLWIAALTRAIPVLDRFFPGSHKGLFVGILDLSNRTTVRLVEGFGISI